MLPLWAGATSLPELEQPGERVELDNLLFPGGPQRCWGSPPPSTHGERKLHLISPGRSKEARSPSPLPPWFPGCSRSGVPNPCSQIVTCPLPHPSCSFSEGPGSAAGHRVFCGMRSSRVLASVWVSKFPSRVLSFPFVSEGRFMGLCLLTAVGPRSAPSLLGSPA